MTYNRGIVGKGSSLISGSVGNLSRPVLARTPSIEGGPLSFVGTLRAAGIEQGSRSYADYERGKAILRKLPTTFYPTGIRILAEYVKV